MKQRVDGGFKDSKHVTQTLRFVCPKLYLTVGFHAPIKKFIGNFWEKLGAIYCKLSLLSKPMQIYNSDETGVTIVHKSGKVITALGHHHVYSVTSAEKVRTHTVLLCVSASGFVVPPCILYPHKRTLEKEQFLAPFFLTVKMVGSIVIYT